MTLDEIKSAIAALPLNDCADLRPWLLAHYDARGYPQTENAKRWAAELRANDQHDAQGSR
ncbi:MAG: hypothetical protein ABSE64_09830 [Vulcanimicrobiaceae bacterium]|jgi:hypothetical protein